MKRKAYPTIMLVSLMLLLILGGTSIVKAAPG